MKSNNIFNSVHHVAIISSDYQKSKDFYVNKLGLEVIEEIYRKERDSYKLALKVGGKYQIELFSFPNPLARLTMPEACGLRHLALEVDDVAAVIEYLKIKGITTEPVRIDATTNKKFTFFKDPDELPIEIYEN